MYGRWHDVQKGIKFKTRLLVVTNSNIFANTMLRCLFQNVNWSFCLGTTLIQANAKVAVIFANRADRWHGEHTADRLSENVNVTDWS